MVAAEKPYRIEWRPKAREDLRAIVQFIGKDAPTRARAFGRDLHDKTLPLAQHPELGHTGRPGLAVPARELVVHRNHIVFYRVLHETRTVEILRVKHAAQQRP
ncbi:MAG: type II toxin-antitoxin system RelE/ParE family toxin [Thiotrichales bacterium]